MTGAAYDREVAQWRRRHSRKQYYLLHSHSADGSTSHLVASIARGASRAAWVRTPAMVHMAITPVAAMRLPRPYHTWRAPEWAWALVPDDEAVWAALRTLAMGDPLDRPLLDVSSLPMLGRDWVAR